MEKAGITYPVAIDVDSATTSAFAVDSYPDYYLIDRAGNLRVADLANSDLERAVKVLLAEPAPIAPALADASARARKKDKRILAVWGDQQAHGVVDAAFASDRALAQLLRNEFEVVHLERKAHPELAEAHGAAAGVTTLATLDASGALVARFEGKHDDAAALTRFLEASRIPARDAENIWRDALAQATKENKRVLVHLGAPW